MYGLAGHKYTPGMPYLSAFETKERRQRPVGVAGPQTDRLKAGMGKKNSRQRHKEAKRAQADAKADW